jgi:cell wall-associated NlpC family hydrolase
LLSHSSLRRISRTLAFALAVSMSIPADALAGKKPGSGGAGLGGTAAVDTSGHRYPGDSEHMGDRILALGMDGHDVRVLQDYLTRARFSTRVTGHFGYATRRSVVAFERANGFTPNGYVTFAVSQKLRAIVAKLESVSTGPVGRATISHGLAVPPANAPTVIRNVIAAANRIAFKPYLWGGGHGSWNSSGYDCSGSVSYALHGGGLLSSPLDSTGFESYGSSGAGRWITIWTNSGHAYMYVAGLRFDTSAQSSTGGSRWTTQARSNAGFVERHPRGW